MLLIPILAGFAQSAQATLISPIAASVESGTPWNVGGGVNEIIDGDTTAGPNGFGFRPLSGSGDDRVRLTLSDAYDLSAVSIWNNGGGIDNDTEGLKDFKLTFLDSTLTNLGTYTSSILDIQTGETQAINASGVSFVDLTFLSSHGAGYAIITETQFEGEETAVVPAPTTLALLTLGLVGICYTKKRKLEA